MAISTGDINDLKAKIVDARTALVSMLAETERTKQEGYDATVKKLTNETLALFTALLAKAGATNAGSKLKELKEAWDVFRATRDNQIIPDFFAGRVAEAKAVGGGIQKERFAKMSALLDELMGMV